MTTLADLRTRVLQRADMAKSKLFAVGEVNSYISVAGRELHGHLVTNYEDDLTQKSLTACSLGYLQLSGDVWKLRGIDKDLGTGQYQSLKPYDWADRTLYQTPEYFAGYGITGAIPRYRIVGRTIYFEPESCGAGVYRLWYVPTWIELTSDSDVLGDAYEPWADYIVVRAAMLCLEKEESDTSALEYQRKLLEHNIKTQGSNRDCSRNGKVSRTRRW